MENQFQCPITGLIADGYQPYNYSFFYQVIIDEEIHYLLGSRLLTEFLNKNVLYKSLLCGIIANNRLGRGWTGFIPGKVHFMDHFDTRSHLFAVENIFEEFGLPRTQVGRFDFILNLIYENLKGPDGSMRFSTDKQTDCFYYYCSSFSDFLFFIRSFAKANLIEIKEIKSEKTISVIVRPTIEGFLHLERKQKEVQRDLCFVAMSFGENEKAIFTEAIEPAVRNCGYQARKVDDLDHHMENGQTINDSILALAKKAYFLVCDYTANKHGVYFEHGYAWGLDKKVIMTCKESEMTNLHFDVNHYPFIVWKDYSDLRSKLQYKIESWIGRFDSGSAQ